MAKKMLIDATHPEETRVVVVDGNKVEDFDYESINKRQLAGNIYLAKVTRVEPSLQAAFVDYGGNRHGFLAFSEVHPDYYQIPIADREALLAEDEREERERQAREDAEGDEAANRKKGRGRGRSKSGTKRGKKTDAAPAAAAVAGLEVIDVLDADGAEVPKGLEMAEPDETGAPAEAEPLLAEDPAKDDVAVADDTGAAESAEPVQDAPEVETAPVEDVSADDAADTDAPDAGDDDPDGPSKTVAESAGLDDDDRVTGDIPDGETARKTGDDAVDPGAADPGPAETEAPAPDDTPDASTTEDNRQSAGDDTAEAQADSPADDENQPREKSTRSRSRRRSRGKKKTDATDEAPTEAQPEEGAEATEDGEIESMGADDTLEEAAQSRVRLRRRYKIQDVIKVRQILLVQVVKEERGNKGAALTTYLSLAGRYCVLMPNTARGGGISRKITHAGDRKRLREITTELEVPKGMGLIVRTAGAERTRAEIKRDYEFLIRQWEQIRDLTLESIAPTLIYEEGSLIKRSIRDIYSKEIDQILVEGDASYREAKEYMKMLMPSHAKNVQPYTDPIPLLTRFQVESYLNGMFNPTVQLRSGGYIVIGVTEALVAIDVNSGRATKQGSIEETATQTNLEACDEVARQLRLRDLAGLIVIDFIDMDENRNNRAVEKRMKDRLKNDRARIQIGRISGFGLMEMSRQRLRPGMLEATTQPCPHCLGVGLIRSDDSLSLSILREVEEEGVRNRSDEITVRVPVDIANYLVNHKREHIKALEERHSIAVVVLGDPSLTSPNFEIDRARTSGKRPPARGAVINAESAVTDAEVIEETEAAPRPEGDEARPKKRRGRRGGRKKRGNTPENAAESEGEAEASTDAPAEATGDATDAGDAGEDSPKPKRRRRSRGKRTGDGDAGGETQEAQADSGSDPAAATDDNQATPEATVTDDAPVADASPEPAPAETPPAEEVATAPEPEPTPEPATPEPATPEPAMAETVVEPVVEPPAPAEPEPSKPKRRGWWSLGR